MVPIRFGGAITGLLWVGNWSRRPFTPRDVAVLSKLADQAAVALENSRLYGRAEELAVSRERVRLAAELHDTLTQMLFSMAQEVLHRTLQEALANIAKHARATRASIRIEVGQDTVAFEVVDDGVGPARGVDAERGGGPGHLGLRLMFGRIPWPPAEYP